MGRGSLTNTPHYGFVLGQNHASVKNFIEIFQHFAICRLNTKIQEGPMDRWTDKLIDWYIPKLAAFKWNIKKKDSHADSRTERPTCLLKDRRI